MAHSTSKNPDPSTEFDLNDEESAFGGYAAYLPEEMPSAKPEPAKVAPRQGFFKRFLSLICFKFGK